MNRFKLFMICSMTMTNLLFPTTVNGRLLLDIVNDSTFEAKIQINTNTGTDDMGGATIVLRFDTTQFYIPPTLSSDTSYVFHNFSGGHYSVAFVTKPFPNELWINIELESNNNGTTVSGLTSWTDVVTLKMKLIGSSPFGMLNFAVDSPFWAIFDGNNTSMWENGDFSQISSVEVECEMPAEYVLFQNYPNPFNPTTKIKYTLREESQVKLVIYNLLGEIIKVWVDNKITAGNHEFTFDSEGLPSGIYVYRLEANNKFIGAKKMILLK
jgi:hypothetical protein